MLQGISFVLLAAVKQRTTEMSFVFNIGPSHPISEIVTSHNRLKKTRVIENCMFF